MAQGREVDRHRFGPTEQDAAGAEQLARDQDQQRQEYGPDHVDVTHRIQTHAPEHVGSVVAEVPGHIAMRRFVQGDCEDDGNGIDGERLDEIQFH
jgi:hypothetical protein